MLVDVREYEACLPPPPWSMTFRKPWSGVSTVAFQHWNYHGNKSRIRGSITEFRRNSTENRKVVLRWRRLMRERILLLKTTTLPSHFPLAHFFSQHTAHTRHHTPKLCSTQHTAQHTAHSTAHSTQQSTQQQAAHSWSISLWSDLGSISFHSIPSFMPIHSVRRLRSFNITE